MNTRLRTVVFLMIILGVWSSGNAQSGSLTEVISCQSMSSDLANALAEVAWISHLPMIAELAQPLPKIEVAEGTYVVKDLLQGIVRQAPEYRWEANGRVIHFYSTKLREASFNFLDLTFQRFIMPPNLSELKLTFPTLEYGLLRGSSTGGYFISGFGDTALEKNLLQPATLKNVTGREILLRAANENPTFLTVIVFPNNDPTKKQMELDMNRNWFWHALGGERPGTLYVQPPALNDQ